MPTLYAECHRRLQDRHDSRPLADRVEQLIVHSQFSDADVAFIESREFFFLATANLEGHPTVSYKGGAPGFVRVQDNTLLFPHYDGNGMFLSAGNIEANQNVGLLFIDFETPHRLRVQGVARLDDGPAREKFPGAQFLMRVEPRQIFINCGRYIHRYGKLETSPYTPDENGRSPLPDWKRLDVVHDVLPPRDQAAALEAGLISLPQEAPGEAHGNKG